MKNRIIIPVVMELRAAKRFRPREEVLTKIKVKTKQVCVPEIPTMYTADRILKAVCVSLSINAESITSQSRKKSLSQVRFIAIGLSLRLSHKVTLKCVGVLLNRDHSTIIHGKQLFNDLYIHDKEFKEKTDMVILHLTPTL